MESDPNIYLLIKRILYGKRVRLNPILDSLLTNSLWLFSRTRSTLFWRDWMELDPPRVDPLLRLLINYIQADVLGMKTLLP